MHCSTTVIYTSYYTGIHHFNILYEEEKNFNQIIYGRALFYFVYIFTESNIITSPDFIKKKNRIKVIYILYGLTKHIYVSYQDYTNFLVSKDLRLVSHLACELDSDSLYRSTSDSDHNPYVILRLVIVPNHPHSMSKALPN